MFPTKSVLMAGGFKKLKIGNDTKSMVLGCEGFVPFLCHNSLDVMFVIDWTFIDCTHLMDANTIEDAPKRKKKIG